MPIVKVPFQSRDFGTPEPTKTQGVSSIPSKGEQKVVAMKTTNPSSKRRKVSVLNEEDIDNTIVESPKESPIKTTTPTLTQVSIPTNKPEKGSKEEQEEDYESELDSLFLELDSVVTKPQYEAS